MVLYSLWFLIAVAVAALAGVLVAFSRLTLRVEYKRQGSDDRLLIEVVALWGLLRYGLTVPGLEMEQGAAGVRIEATDGEGLNARGYFAGLSVVCRLVQRLSAFCLRYRQAMDYLWRRSRVTSFEWHTTLGTGEAATTGVVCGWLWGVKGFALGQINPLRRTPGSISVDPDFRSPTFATSVNLTAVVQLRHLLTASRRFFAALKGSKNEGGSSRPHGKKR
ncbi:MAG TPA: DUF2953 domain-containing protein [Desulfotomaculum sp.]|nr:DUF2953 domain-containing protein [Desulfotomaculum sp.]